MEENKEEKGRIRIRDFFAKENLFSLYSGLLPSSLPSQSIVHDNKKKGRKIYKRREGEEE